MKVNRKRKSAMTALVVAAMLCTAVMPVKADWVYENDSWSLVKDDGSKATGWIKEGDCWYAFDENGRMRTGWIASDENWYFMGESGVMQTESWVEDQGSWYFIKGTGIMAKDYVKDGFECNSDGKAVPLGESGSVIVTDPSEIEGKVIEGNLYIDASTAEEIELKNVKVKGKLVIIGDNKTGGKVTLTDSTVETISNQTRNTEIVLSGETEVKHIVLEETGKVTPAEDYKGEVESFEIQSTTKEKVVIEIPVKKVTARTYAGLDIQAPVENLEVQKETQIEVNADVENVAVTESAKDTNLEVTKGNKVGTLTADAPLSIEGEGTVNKVEANAEGVEASDETIIKDVVKGEDVTEAPNENKPSTGGSSGGNKPVVTVPTVIVTTKAEFDEAVAGAAEKTKIVLNNHIDLGDVDAEEDFIIIPENKDIILDLNGKTMNGRLLTNAQSYAYYHILTNKGTLTIEDSVGNGKMANTYDSSFQCTRTILNKGTLTINGGEIYSEKGNALINAGTLIINDGAVLTTKAPATGSWNNGSSTLDNRAAVTINGGIFNSGDHVLFSGADTAVTEVKGGTFTAAGREVLYKTAGTYLVSGGSFNIEFSEDYVADGYYVEATGEAYLVKAYNKSNVTVNSAQELEDAIRSTTDANAKTIIVNSDLTLSSANLLKLAKNSQLIINENAALTIDSPIDIEGTLHIKGTVNISENGYIGHMKNINLDNGASLNYNAQINSDTITVSKPMDMQWVAYHYMMGNSVIRKINISADLDYQNAYADPIGKYNSIFIGEVSGNDHTISNVKIEESSNAALFAYAGNVTISNLNVTNISVKGGTARAATLVAEADGNLKIENVSVSGSVDASSYYAGGLIGSIESDTGETVQFINCTTGINLTSDYNVGALWGTSQGSKAVYTLRNCINTGVITGSTAGVFAGYSDVGEGSTYSNLSDTTASGLPLFGRISNFTEAVIN